MERRVNVAIAAKTRHRSTNRPATKARLGQNFLTDAAATQRIVDALGDITDSTVVEIGPGRGAITKLLAAKAMWEPLLISQPALSGMIKTRAR